MNSIFLLIFRPGTAITCLLLHAFLSGCSQETGYATSLSDKEFTAGNLYPSVALSPHTTYTYALYLPKSYNGRQKLPVLYAFDSHAKGAVPIAKYAALAEQYQYILIGSNDSKNGLSPEQTKKIADTLFTRTQQLFAIDQDRIYLTGFSGGARVAVSLGVENKKIHSVIGCAAGFPQLLRPVSSGFRYFGFIGNKDFNYLEMKELDKMLDATNIEHLIRDYSGDHEWPPSSIMSKAFDWLETNEMRKMAIPKNINLLQKIKSYQEHAIDSLLKENALIPLVDEIRITIQYLDLLVETSLYESQAQMIANKPEYKMAQLAQNNYTVRENQLKENYKNAVSNRDIEWWKSEVEKTKNTQSKVMQNMYYRALNYASLVTYMNATTVLNQNQLSMAERYLEIYRIVDPDNAEAYYLSAKLAMRQHNLASAATFLKQATTYGFEDVLRFQGDKDFDKLTDKEIFVQSFTGNK